MQLDTPLSILIAFLLAAAPSVLLCRVVMSMKIMDAPNEARKIQPRAIPTSGGLAVATSTFLAAVAVSELTNWTLDVTVLVVGGASFIALLVGLADDILTLRAFLRLVLITGIALGMTIFGPHVETLVLWPGVSLQLPLVLGVLGSAFWLVVIINAVNFMDGANGLAMGMAAVAAAGLAICGAVVGAWDIALLSGALAGALAGFLVWNVRGKLFVGDAGAYFAGAMLGGLSLELVRVRPDLLFVPPMLLLPFLSDVLLTLAWRSKHGKALFASHRDHAYQIAMKAGLKHWQVSTVHAVFALNAVVLAVVTTILGGYAPAVAFIALLVVSTWTHWKVRRSGVANGLVGADIA